MGGDIQWSALDTVAVLVGVEDIEALVRGLVVIREHFRKQAEAEAKARA